MQQVYTHNNYNYYDMKGHYSKCYDKQYSKIPVNLAK